MLRSQEPLSRLPVTPKWGIPADRSAHSAPARIETLGQRQKLPRKERGGRHNALERIQPTWQGPQEEPKRSRHPRRKVQEVKGRADDTPRPNMEEEGDTPIQELHATYWYKQNYNSRDTSRKWRTSSHTTNKHATTGSSPTRSTGTTFLFYATTLLQPLTYDGSSKPSPWISQFSSWTKLQNLTDKNAVNASTFYRSSPAIREGLLPAIYVTVKREDINDSVHTEINQTLFTTTPIVLLLVEKMP
ncbi:unnamed protein product [Mytilus coruscus]|uniref:Uncharacterized protein n=1 Tax=Mytilus coruscus TaxID=42192 RepID=A0A6J8EHB1_MYTCO|nr:unnamed protein product [Mytilus coruscus]